MSRRRQTTSPGSGRYKEPDFDDGDDHTAVSIPRPTLKIFAPSYEDLDSYGALGDFYSYSTDSNESFS
ncbi:MAG: hypothetical protein H8D43_02715 [Chloroflexi bacterium]|nr:hypothetical protein [Chloroflexota bacterium]